MSIKDLKQKLKDIIDNTDDENLLHLMQEDAAFYATARQKDITDGLTEEQINELKEMMGEGDEKIL
jgi:hypothetical protein